MGKKDFEELKRVLPGYETFTALKRVSETEKAGQCPFCGGVDRFRVTDKGWFFCRQCAPDKNSGAGDIIAFHQKKQGLTIPELCKQYLPGYSKAEKNKPMPEQPEQPASSLKDWKNKRSKTKELALNLLHVRRKIDKKIVSELFEAGQIKTGEHKGKDTVAFPFFDLSSENVHAIQYITVDTKPFPFTAKNGSPANKIFRKGSKPGSDCFFTVGASIQDTRTDLIISESVINAITALECVPGACSLALGGSTYTRKLESLKPLTNGRRVVVCGDHDQPGEKMVVKIRQALGNTVRAISFNPEDKTGCDINDLLQAEQKERIIKLINDAELVPDTCLQEDEREAERKEKEKTEWELAEEMFPRTGFPWHSLPGGIAESFKQLARSCATSSLSIPGAAMAIFSSVLGSTICVSPKSSWKEPLIFWFGDVRPSGTGKTPAARALCKVIDDAQKKADDEEKKAKDIEASRPAKDREPVTRARGYFITNLTLEGVRDDISGHGGTVCIMDELSSFLNGQNQYKSSGTDRESWLVLHDGNDARVVRAGNARTIRGARVNIFGGIQPKVFKQCFTDKNGLYLEDGTLFRFLLTHGTYETFKATLESWEDENKKVWEDALFFAMQWADTYLSDHGLEAKVLILNEDAQELFIDWVNNLKEMLPQLPVPLRGFIPKSHGYALRLAGLSHCIDCFARDQAPGSVIDSDAIQKGIDIAEFYLSHAVTLLESLERESMVLSELTEQGKILTDTLEKLRPEVESGKLAIGYIWEHFNKAASKENKFKSAKAMGAFLRNFGLTIPEGTYRANKKAGVRVLIWDRKTESFLKQSPQSPQHQQSYMFASVEIEKPKSAKSTKKEEIINSVDIVDIEKPKSTSASLSVASAVDFEDFEDINSKENKKNVLPDDVEIIEDGVFI